MMKSETYFPDKYYLRVPKYEPCHTKQSIEKVSDIIKGRYPLKTIYKPLSLLKTKLDQQQCLLFIAQLDITTKRNITIMPNIRHRVLD